MASIDVNVQNNFDDHSNEIGRATDGGPTFTLRQIFVFCLINSLQ